MGKIYKTNLGRTGFIEKDKIHTISGNRAKPKGGLWASRMDAHDDWEKWCKSEQPDWLSNENALIEVNDDAKILVIDSEDVVADLANRYPGEKVEYSEYSIDWKKLGKDYDVVEFRMDDYKGMYCDLYGVDCDSVCITNKDAVASIQNPEQITYLMPRDTEVIISEGTTEIKENDYENYPYLNHVEFPGALKKIGKNAFSGDFRLHCVNIPASCTTIGDSAFLASGLDEIHGLENVQYIGEYAFNDCDLKGTLDLSGVKEIGKGAFKNNIFLEEVIISENTITHDAFDSWVKVTVRQQFTDNIDMANEGLTAAKVRQMFGDGNGPARNISQVFG